MSNLVEEFRNTLRSNISNKEVLNKIDPLLDEIRKYVMYDLGNKEHKKYIDPPMLPICEPVKVLTGSDITVCTIKHNIANFSCKLTWDKHMCVSVIFDTKPLKSWISRVSKKLYTYKEKLNISDDEEHLGEFMMEMDKIPTDLPIKQVIITAL
jgi:hypothetical protein